MRSLVLLLTAISLLANTPATAQEWSLGVGYRYMYAAQWDKIIQTYNTSRPFLKEKQPLLVNGTLAEISYHFKSKKKLGSGINLGHSYVGSSVSNEGFSTKLSLHLVDLGYTMRFRPKPKSLEYELGIAAIAHILSSHVDGETLKIDDKAYRSYGIGGKLQATVLYRFQLTDAWTILPFIGLSYSPYIYSPRTEPLINQTDGLINGKRATLLTGQAGLRFSFSPRKSGAPEINP